jgi:hypothetical protein
MFCDTMKLDPEISKWDGREDGTVRTTAPDRRSQARVCFFTVGLVGHR